MHRLIPGFLTLPLLLGCTTPPYSGVIIATESSRELGVSTRFGIVAIGAAQREGEVEVTATYGDGPATETGRITPVDAGLCRIEVPFPTPWCEISSTLPSAGESLLLCGFDSEGELWTEDVLYNPPADSRGLILPLPDLPADWLLPGVGVYRWELDRWRLVGLLCGEVEWKGRRWLVGQGPIQLARFISHDHNRNRPQHRGVYRRDVRAR